MSHTGGQSDMTFIIAVDITLSNIKPGSSPQKMMSAQS